MFAAVIVNEYTSPDPTAGVPANVAVPSPLSTNVTPTGKTPAPIDNAVASGKSSSRRHRERPRRTHRERRRRPRLVIDGASTTVNVNACTAFGDVGVRGRDRKRVHLTRPDRRRTRQRRRPIPVVHERHTGGQNTSANRQRRGQREIVSGRHRERPRRTHRERHRAGLVIDGASSTVSTNDWVAFGNVEFAAVIVNG